MKKLGNIIIILLVVMILALSTISNAVKVEVTKEKLKDALNNLKNLNSENNEIDSNIMNLEDGFEFEVTDDIIKISSAGDKIEMKYSLTGKPTFTSEILVKNGMSYEEFEEEYNKVLSPVIGYMLVSNIQGTKYEDSIIYVFMYLFATVLSGDMDSSEYIVYDDKEGNSIPQVSENQKLIKQSEFDKYVMKYVNSIFKDDIILKDTEGDAINSFELTVEKEDVTDSSCKIVSTLSVNLDADFAKIEDLVEELPGSITNSLDDSINVSMKDTNSIDDSINVSLKDTNSVIGNDKDNDNESENTVANVNSIPKAGTEFGFNNILQIVIFVSILSIIIILITSKKEKN